MEDAGFVKDIALLVIGAVAGVAPWLLDKIGVEMPKPVYVGLLLFSAILVGWAFNSLGWLEKIPILRDKRLPLSTGLICGIVLSLSVWLLLREGMAETKYDSRKWQSDKNEVMSRKSYLNETVEIDGKTFDHCSFTNVTLMYHGTASTSFLDSTFQGSLALRTDNVAAKGFGFLQSYLRAAPGVVSYTLGEIDDKGNIREIEKMTKNPPATPSKP
jgi:hypothetical protein